MTNFSLFTRSSIYFKTGSSKFDIRFFFLFYHFVELWMLSLNKKNCNTFIFIFAFARYSKFDKLANRIMQQVRLQSSNPLSIQSWKRIFHRFCILMTIYSVLEKKNLCYTVQTRLKIKKTVHSENSFKTLSSNLLLLQNYDNFNINGTRCICLANDLLPACSIKPSFISFMTKKKKKKNQKRGRKSKILATLERKGRWM